MWFRRSKPVQSQEEEIQSIYPRFTYLITWKFRPEPRRAISANTIHFDRQLTMTQLRQLRYALESQDPNFSCTVKSVTGKPAIVALTRTSLQIEVPVV